MNSTILKHSMPFSLSKSISGAIIVPHAISRRKQNQLVKDDSSDEERRAVEKLSDWEKKEAVHDTLTSISEAKIALKRRIDGEDLVEEIKFRRKNKSTLPDINSKKLIPVIKSLKLRQAKKDIEANLREKFRYCRMFEYDLQCTYEGLMKELMKAKVDRDLLREECCELKRRSVLFNEQLEKLKEYTASFESNGRTKFTQGELAAWMQKRDNLRKEIEIKEKEKIKISQEVLQEVEARSKRLLDLDELSKTLRKRIEQVRSSQRTHYINLLKEGKDTRSEGLKWIVIALWKIGESITIENFPPFLDPDAVYFILFIAQKTLEIDEIFEKIINPSRKSIISSAEKLSDRWNNIKARLAQMTKHIEVKAPEYISNISNNNKKSQASSQWVSFANQNESSAHERTLSEPSYYENYISKLKTLVNRATDNEIYRLTVECSLHNYEERYRISAKELINAMVGAESLDKNFSNFVRHKKSLSTILEGSKTLNFADKLS